MSIHFATGPDRLGDPRLRAVHDLAVATAREDSGLHDYDGVLQDLSPPGVATGLRALAAAVATSAPQPDPHDEAQLTAAVTAARARLGELERHRSDPVLHIRNLDVSCYEREYAPPAERRAARDEHVAGWPDAVDAAVTALDRVPAPVAAAALPLARGLAALLRTGEDVAAAAHARFVGHLQRLAEHGDPDPAMGEGPLRRLLESAEACRVDLGELAARADTERVRLQAMLSEYCGRLDATAPPSTTIARLLAQHPSAETLLPAARALVEEAVAWTAQSGLVPHLDGGCEVGLVPESQRWSAASMTWAAPSEPDTPSRFAVAPPDPALPADEQTQWLASYFNRATLPVIAVHEVAPGHFAHSRAWRRTSGPVRRTLYSEAFGEGWAHYCEELVLDEGFRRDDPAFGVGVALDGLRRVTRLRCALGLHTGELTLQMAAAMFTTDAHVAGPAALAEARRGLLDPGYGRYTWGKLAVRDLRERAVENWRGGFTLPRLHRALLALGAPPLGLLDTAIERG